MNKKITLIATLAAASLSMAAGTKGFPDVLWDPANPGAEDGSVHKICTGYADESPACTYSDDAGWWFDYDDQGGTTLGNSYVAALGGEVDDEYDSFMQSNIIANDAKALAVEFTQVKGYAYPFAGIGFKLQAAGEPQNLTAETGLCFVYKAEGPFTIEFESAAVTGDAHFMKQFTKGEGTADIVFAELKQPSWTKAENKSTVDAAFAQITQIKFKRGNDDSKVPGATRFTLSQIAKPGKCTAKPYTTSNSVTVGPTSTPVLNVQAASSVKMQLASRTLSFAGLSSAADVQVINFQGQVVRSATLSSSKSLNLSNLDNGVYLVRVAGQDMSFSQKIVLK